MLEFFKSEIINYKQIQNPNTKFQTFIIFYFLQVGSRYSCFEFANLSCSCIDDILTLFTLFQ